MGHGCPGQMQSTAFADLANAAVSGFRQRTFRTGARRFSRQVRRCGSWCVFVQWAATQRFHTGCLLSYSSSGACVPANCTDDELTASSAVQDFLRSNFPVLYTPGTSAGVACVDMGGGEWDQGAYVTMSITMAIVVVAVACTVAVGVRL